MAGRRQEESNALSFFNDTATTEIYTLSLHDALPIFSNWCLVCYIERTKRIRDLKSLRCTRSEEHTSELQSPYAISYADFCLKKKRQENGRHPSSAGTQARPQGHSAQRT